MTQHYPITPTRRQHPELLSSAEVYLGKAVAEMHRLGVDSKAIISVVDVERQVGNLVDELGDHGHYWTFDHERGGVHCARCKRRKDTATQDGAPCTGDPATNTSALVAA